MDAILVNPTLSQRGPYMHHVPKVLRGLTYGVRISKGRELPFNSVTMQIPRSEVLHSVFEDFHQNIVNHKNWWRLLHLWRLCGHQYTVNQLLFTKTLFRDLLNTNWFATTHFCEKLYKDLCCYNNHTTMASLRREIFSTNLRKFHARK